MDELKIKWNERILEFINNPENKDLIENWEKKLFKPFAESGVITPQILYRQDFYQIIAGLVYLVYGYSFKITAHLYDNSYELATTIQMDALIPGFSGTIYTDTGIKIKRGLRSEDLPDLIKGYMIREEKGNPDFWNTIIKNAEVEIKWH